LSDPTTPFRRVKVTPAEARRLSAEARRRIESAWQQLETEEAAT
jgi:hypothetical protein